MTVEQTLRYTSPSPATVRDRLAKGELEPVVMAHMHKMWQQVLDKEGAPEDPDAGRRDRLGELPLPYVPVQPEACGVHLTESSSVLEVGAYSGYGIYDFCRRRAAAGLPLPRITGIDVEPPEVEAGLRVADLWTGDLPEVRFLEADCEDLPFASGSFDMVIARGVLQYVDVVRGLRELRRVLRPAGLAIIQMHSPRFYVARVAQTLGEPRRLTYFLRPLVTGALLTYTGRQPRSPRMRETALTLRGLHRLCRESGLVPVWRRPSRYRPLVVFRAAE